MKEYKKEDIILIIERINKMNRFIFQYKKEKKKEPTNEEISIFMKEPIERIIELKNRIKELEKESNELENVKDYFYDYTSSNEIKIKNQEEYQELRKKIIEYKNILEDKEKEILFERFSMENNKNYTLFELSKKYNLPRKMIRKILVDGLTKIKEIEKNTRRTVIEEK